MLSSLGLLDQAHSRRPCRLLNVMVPHHRSQLVPATATASGRVARVFVALSPLRSISQAHPLPSLSKYHRRQRVPGSANGHEALVSLPVSQLRSTARAHSRHVLPRRGPSVAPCSRTCRTQERWTASGRSCVAAHVDASRGVSRRSGLRTATQEVPHERTARRTPPSARA